MIFPIIFALLLAWLMKYPLKPVLTAYALYPFAILTLGMIYLQASVFLHEYSLIRCAAFFKSIYLFSLVIPFLVYRLYKPGLFGAGSILVGTLLNKLVMAQNGGKMPVYATLSRLTGYYSDAIIKSADTVHIAGDASTKLKFLTDYIDIGYSILSIGDLFIHAFAFIIVFYTIKEIGVRRCEPLQTNG